MRTKVSATPPTATPQLRVSTSAAKNSVRFPQAQSNGAARVAAGGLAKNGASDAAKEAVADVRKKRVKKIKNIRYSYRMPETEYAALKELKNRLGGLEVSVKKSELVRAELLLLAGLPERRIQNDVAKILEQKNSEKK